MVWHLDGPDARNGEIGSIYDLGVGARQERLDRGCHRFLNSAIMVLHRLTGDLKCARVRPP